MSNPLLISVIGGSEPPAQDTALAEAVGRELARRGVIVVTGGLGGIMEAACRGAKAESGITIGILPGDDPRTANQYVDYPICTGMGYARNVVVVKSGRAVIAIDGSFGTLSELGHALGDGIPVVGLNTWDLTRNAQTKAGIITAQNPVDAVDRALEAARLREQAEQALIH